MPNKKKAGILTFHRALNYGAVLQAYALEKTLKSIGFDACVIDYRQWSIEGLHFWRWMLKVKHLIHLVLRLKPWRYFTELHAIAHNAPIFNGFVKRNLTVSAKCFRKNGIPQDIDLYVIGSDQLWNRKITSNKFDDVYMGAFPHPSSSKIITYAVSADVNSISDGAECLSEKINGISEVSIRESSLAKIFQERTGLVVRQDVDPTLLAERSVWMPLLNNKFKNKDYVLVYEVRSKQGFQTKIMNLANRIANDNGWEVIRITQKFQESKMCAVEDFVSLFNDARFVLTSSFHGTAFSLIFHKPFYAYTLNDGSDARYVDVLKALGLSSRLKPIEDDVVDLSPVDYTEADQRWNELRKQSLDYLRKYL